VFFSLTKVVSTPTTSRVDFIAPGVLALCVLSTHWSLVDRDGLRAQLRRPAATPRHTARHAPTHRRQIAGVLVTEALQVIILAVVAFALSWRPAVGEWWIRSRGALVLGSAGCAGIGLASPDDFARK